MPDQSRHQIRVINRNQTFECAEDQVLLVGMERHSAAAISVGCRGGGCGICKIRILAGEYETKRMSKAHISEAEQQRGYALACRVFPCTDLEIESDHYQAPESSYQQAAETQPTVK
ncbi:2Fe-2S iron-sulfur cluster-binding protein [Amphritea japonica]|uniref:Ferredoxin--NAD+ reductase n=1 Tax=Amphritea japonica ATCC BAA-1530 TaxID=1278309 RepID=A0A7R6SUE4_9GAMM|nr:2Fe-2S iron-sulfur cluster-binding protein [Amphritea japonica]BBB27587.1 ferredoxin--NAD+ reductase [Amphritea japonica ATCC BAA-1530]